MPDRAQEIFEQVVDLPAIDRCTALNEACAGDRRLRARVESLLAAHDEAGTFLAEPTIDHVAAYSEPAEQAGSTIGRYKLLEKIGQGGFGDVYMAQQFEPVKRRVALKIIKVGMDTNQVVARFDAERQALALMDHPNIARVFDGGETSSGRPYFVMELVRGDPITSYCDRERLSTRDRLRLFQQVCQAIQHAHQKGVIHRDIKPNNVLITIVDGSPLVKVIDFGIAKATNTELTEKTLFTEFRQLIGTPQYMSPEQAERSGVDIDTRSDIYSLGVLLYEMLTGRTPVDTAAIKAAVWNDLQKMICEDEPRRPSMVVTSLGPDSELVAKSRGTNPTSLGNTLKGDLDWIVLKALEKDRTRRYGTASALADDVQRYLSDEAVTATPPSVRYRLRKLVRRNKSAVAVVMTLIATLVLGLITISFSALRVKREMERVMEARRAALAASEQAKQQAQRAHRMAAMVAGNPFLGEEETSAMAPAWLADIEESRQRGDLSERDLFIQECQQAIWWFYHGGGQEAANRIERLYDRAEEILGPGDGDYFALLNANMVSHLREYDATRMADLFVDLVASAKLLKPDEYETLLPQLAAALHLAGRNNEATEAVEQYLAFRKGNRSHLRDPAAEKIRLRGALRDLADWGVEHPDLYKKLEEFQNTLPDMTAN